MNLREGTRRLALLLGVLGAIVGGIASYMELQDIFSQRVRHNEFEKLAGSDIVLGIRKDHRESKNPFEAAVKSVTPGCCGIKEVVWDTDRIFNDPSEIYSIETNDGRKLYPASAPSASMYLFVALFPLIGFLIPWGVVRAIGWVVAGFVHPPK